MQEFNNAANYNLGRGGMLTDVCAKAISLAQQYGKLEEVTSYIKDLPPASSFNNPSPGLDELIAGLNSMQMTQEVSVEARTR